MLGPSGSGKTTVLRMIAGFEAPTSGTIELAGPDVTRLAPFERDVHTVFQDYALFPHMTVEQNVAYGLKVRKVPRAERLARARKALADVRLEDFGDAPPVPALRRSAPARRARPRPGRPPQGAAARRTARRPRPQAARADAGRAQGDPARGRHHLRLRHPRPGGGADDERPHRGLQPGPHRTGRHPGRDLRTPRHPLRRGLRRHLQPAHRRGRASGSSATRARTASGPEKIRVLEESADADDPEYSTATGTVAEVVYLGDATRFLVDLDAGGRLTALQQNLETSSEDVAAYRGTRVRLQWHRRPHLPGPRSPVDPTAHPHRHVSTSPPQSPVPYGERPCA